MLLLLFKSNDTKQCTYSQWFAFSCKKTNNKGQMSMKGMKRKEKGKSHVVQRKGSHSMAMGHGYKYRLYEFKKYASNKKDVKGGL